MAKGKGTATPAKVKQQREAAEALKGGGDGTDAAEVLKRIEAEEREALEKFQEEQKAKREKALSSVLEPLRARRAELDETIRAAETEQGDIDRQIAKLTGQTAKPKGKRREPGMGQRMMQSEKVELAAKAAAFVNSGGKDGVSRSQVAEHLGIAPAQAATVLKALLKEGKIKPNGLPKAAARYLAA